MKVALVLLLGFLVGGCGKDVATPTSITYVTNVVDEPNPLDIVEIVDPCGDALNIVDEVLLKLRNGQIIASFSANSLGKDTRFALLAAGSYITTDGSGCRFTVDADGNVQ